MIDLIRKLAKKIKFQNLFVATKDLSELKIFKNSTDLSKIQEIFLSYLYFYYDINYDITTKKITKDILKDEIYEDAYTYWKREKGFDQSSKNKKGKTTRRKEVSLIFDNSKPFKENKK